MEKQKIISNFLQTQPLYSKTEIDKHYFHPNRFENVTFQFFCPNEAGLQTFMLKLEPNKALGLISSDTLIDKLDPYQQDWSIKFTHHFSGECQFCKKYKVNFLLNVLSDGPIPGLSVYQTFSKPVSGRGDAPTKSRTEHKLFLRKIGQYPAFEINPDKEVINFLEDQDKEFYKKSLICLSQSFGVGAYAYLRRITENEIIRIVESLSEMETTDGGKIKTLYEAYKFNR